MNNQCATTPFLLQAIQLYKLSFALVPPLFAELELHQNQVVKLRYYGIGSKVSQKLWSSGIISVGLFAVNISLYLLVQVFLWPNRIRIFIMSSCIKSVT